MRVGALQVRPITASRQLAATQGRSAAEIRMAGSRNFDWVNEANIRAKQLKESRARQQAGLAESPVARQVPSDDPASYYPVRTPGSGRLHLIYGDMPGVPTLCGKFDARDVREALGIEDVTCRVCRAVAGDSGGPPKSPFILTGRCPKCSRSVVWYKLRDKMPVHTATGGFECPPDGKSEESASVVALPDSPDGTGVAAELERLAALHSSGALDDEEFRAAKARIINGG